MDVRKLILPFVFLFTVLLVACGRQRPLSPLPDQLAGLYLVRVEKGETARNKLSKMHHEADFSEYESMIGSYIDKDVKAMVYLTIFDSEEKSAEMMSRMVENIKAQKYSEFSYMEQFEKTGRTIHSAGGMGRMYYFFQDGKRNVWISVPPTLSELMLNDFLNKSQAIH